MELIRTTKDGKQINLREYSDIKHIKNIKKMLEKKLHFMPYVEYPEGSESDSDGAYRATQCLQRDWEMYENNREYLIRYIKELDNILNTTN